MGLDFYCYMPTRIIFGAGSLNELADTPHLPGEHPYGHTGIGCDEKADALPIYENNYG